VAVREKPKSMKDKEISSFQTVFYFRWFQQKFLKVLPDVIRQASLCWARLKATSVTIIVIF
jgi:hypothetical protein